jgi:MFS family permease
VTGVFASAVVLLSRIRPDARRDAPAGLGGLGHELLAGARAISAEVELAVLTGLYGAQTFVAGALNVLVVVAALELLAVGDAGVGYLNAAIGVGGLVGAGAMFALVGARRLAPYFALGMILWGLPMLLLAAWPNEVFAFAVLGVLGVGNTLVDVAGVTLLQRSVPNDVLARVFGVLESLTWGTIALGSIAASGLVLAVGGRWAFALTGALLPLLTAVAWRQLRALDARAPDEQALRLLRGVPFLSPLPPPVVEGLAARLQHVRFVTGEVVFERGDPGDAFYIIESGEVEVQTDTPRPVVLRRGDFFGEIALMETDRRTATVTASSPMRLIVMHGRDFREMASEMPHVAEKIRTAIRERTQG